MEKKYPRIEGAPKMTATSLKNLKTTKSYNHYYLHDKKWYYHLTPNDNYHALYDDFKMDSLKDHLVIRYTKRATNEKGYNNLYTQFDSYIDFYKYQLQISLNDRCFYEIINGFQKPYFDIDMKMDDEEKMKLYFFNTTCTIDKLQIIGSLLVSTIIKSCQIIMKPNVLDLTKNLLLYTSHNSRCLSYHIVIDGWYLHDCFDAKAFYYKVKNLTSFLLQGKYVEFMDSNVYKRNQAFRLLGSHKHTNNRTKIFKSQFKYFEDLVTHMNEVTDESLEHALFAKSLVGFVANSQPLPFFNTNPFVKKLESITLSEMDIKKIQEMLEKEFKNLFSIRKINGGTVQLLRKHPYNCPVCNKKHMHENPRILVLDGCVKWDCRRNDNGHKKILGYLEPTDVKVAVASTDVEEEDDTGNFLNIGGEVIDLTQL